MSKEHEKLKKDVNTNGSKLIKEVVEILSMKSLANRFPYPITVENVHLGYKNNVITVQGKQNTLIHCKFVVSPTGITFIHHTLADKPLSDTRSNSLKSALDSVLDLFRFFDVTPFEIALESNQGSVALVASTSQGRVAIVGIKGS